METTTTCPRCGSGDVLPILYGMPGPEMTEDSMAGKIALGGCVVFPDASAGTAATTGASRRWGMAEGLQELFREIRRARTPDEIDRAEANAAAHIEEHPEDEMPVLQAGEMLAMKRESAGLYGIASE